jgi:hypothetical protein
MHSGVYGSQLLTCQHTGKGVWCEVCFVQVLVQHDVDARGQAALRARREAGVRRMGYHLLHEPRSAASMVCAAVEL